MDKHLPFTEIAGDTAHDRFGPVVAAGIALIGSGLIETEYGFIRLKASPRKDKIEHGQPLFNYSVQIVERDHQRPGAEERQQWETKYEIGGYSQTMIRYDQDGTVIVSSSKHHHNSNESHRLKHDERPYDELFEGRLIELIVEEADRQSQDETVLAQVA